MYETSSQINIKAPVNKVYGAVKDVSKWPEIFPPCQSVNIESESDNELIMKITALTKGRLFSWLSIRKADDRNYRVNFQQLEPVTPLIYMSGSWNCEVCGDNTRVELIHTFDLKSLRFKRILAWVIKCFFINSNSVRELRGLKTYLERGKCK